jgi:hypothetical protein
MLIGLIRGKVSLTRLALIKSGNYFLTQPEKAVKCAVLSRPGVWSRGMRRDKVNKGVDKRADRVIMVGFFGAEVVAPARMAGWIKSRQGG